MKYYLVSTSLRYPLKVFKSKEKAEQWKVEQEERMRGTLPDHPAATLFLREVEGGD